MERRPRALQDLAKTVGRSDWIPCVMYPAEECTDDVDAELLSESVYLPGVSLAGQDDATFPWQLPSNPLDSDTEFLNRDVDILDAQDDVHASSPDSETSEQHRNAFEMPLDQPSWTFLLLGDSGEADPHLHKRSTLHIHADNLHFRRFHRERTDAELLDCQRPIVFMLGRDSLYNDYEPQIEPSQLSAIHKELDRFNSDVRFRLIKLYFKYIYPYFPVLSRTDIFPNECLAENATSKLSPSLMAALYACALPYMVYDDVLSTMLDLDLPTAKSLYRMCWTAITQEIHTPRLSTLQACLLLLQRDTINPYVQGSPFQWGLSAWTVSLAQTLGLSTDCSTVKGMPAWEKRVRKRLWWATYVLDKWNFASSGLTSHIRKDDYDVLPLAEADCVPVDSSYGMEAVASSSVENLAHFRHLAELTVLLSDTTDAFFTIKACSTTAHDFSGTCALANDLQARLEAWKTSFDALTAVQPVANSSFRARLDGNASLGLAYWVVHLLIFRAILRALEATGRTAEDKKLRDERRESVRLGAELCCVEVVEYVDKLQAGAWNAFWHKCTPPPP